MNKKYKILLLRFCLPCISSYGTIGIQGKRGDFMSTVAVRVDDKLKDEAAELFQSLGLDMSTAVKMFLIQSVKTQSIPFEIKNTPSISDEEFEHILLSKLEGKKLDFNKTEDIAEFFNEDFPEYEVRNE